MYLTSLFFVALALVCAQSRYITEDMVLVPVSIPRVRRDVHGGVTVNSDFTSDAMLKVPFAGDGKNVVSAIGKTNFDENFKLSAATAGLALDNINGHSATLTKTHEPNFGDRLTATGTMNVFNNDNHNLDVNAFARKNMPDIPHMPDFNTYGGGVDYTFMKKLGASASVAHSDVFDRNDYSVGGKLNLFKDQDTSIDFNTDYRKFDMPGMKSGWEPSFGFSFSKFW